jgi:hypothetical protein
MAAKRLMDPRRRRCWGAGKSNSGRGFRPRNDRTTLLTMRVRGINELTNWVLGFWPHVKVLRLAALRERWRVTCGPQASCTRRRDGTAHRRVARGDPR